MSESTTEKDQVSEKSPFAGCAILIVAAAVMIFLIGFSITVLFRQFNEIVKFTDEKPAVVPVVSLEGKEAELNTLAEKLEAFRLGLGGEETAILELNASELNLAIHTYKDFEDLRGMLDVKDISPEEIRFDISFQLNGKPRLGRKEGEGMFTSDPRYLNGVLIAEPGLLNQEVVLQVRDIKVPDKVVPREFLEQMSPYRIAERYVGDSTIGDVMGQLTNVELGDGFIRFEKVAGEVAKDTISDEDVDLASTKLFTFLGIAASIFLLIVAVILILGLRLKKRRDASV
ncbi:hypothetical protein [Luteolibacter sp. AS25]|uniref:hypothetical protein n=1 Tax=Luteolibacter sp. AS25 TaxID=3135776 RepID=UPI00398A9FD5